MLFSGLGLELLDTTTKFSLGKMIRSVLQHQVIRQPYIPPRSQVIWHLACTCQSLSTPQSAPMKRKAHSLMRGARQGNLFKGDPVKLLSRARRTTGDPIQGDKKSIPQSTGVPSHIIKAFRIWRHSKVTFG